LIDPARTFLDPTRIGQRIRTVVGCVATPDPLGPPTVLRRRLISGEGYRSAIGAPVERSTRYVMLLHLPIDHTAAAVRDALTKTVSTLPAHLRRSLTWDQGKKMYQHRLFAIDTDVPVFFCGPHSPWHADPMRTL